MITIRPKIPLVLLVQYGKSNRNSTHKIQKYFRYYSQKAAETKTRKSGSLGGFYAVGTLAVISGAALCYAKFDNDFRNYLKDNIPFSDSMIKFIFQEELTYKDHYEKLEKSVTGIFTPATSTTETIKVIEQKEQNVLSAISPSTSGKTPTHKTSYTKESEKKEDSVPLTTVSTPVKEERDARQDYRQLEEDESAKEIYHNIDNQISEAANIALKSYTLAMTTLQNFVKDVDYLVENNFEKVDAKTWHNLKVLSEQKTQAVQAAEREAREALDTIKLFKSMVEHRDIRIPEHRYAETLENIKNIEKKIVEAKENYTKGLQNASITERFWDKVEQARKQYQEELGILCPSLKLDERQLKLGEGETDLFILYAQKKMQYLQKELAKMETKRERELARALERAKQMGNADPLIEEHIKAYLDQEKRTLMENFQKKVLEVQADAEKEIKAQLKRQAEAHTEHLIDAIKAKEMELKRNFDRRLNEEIVKAKMEYKVQLAAMVGRLKGVDNALKVRADADKNAHQAQALWSACQALHHAIKSEEGERDAKLQPLANEIKAIKNAADESDELVKAVVSSIPEVAVERGVFNETYLRERFPHVEKIARRLALIPDNGASLPVYLLSYIQSFLLYNSANPITEAELKDEIVDFSTFTNHDILQRAKYWLDRGDFHQTLRYMNLLQGASRKIAEEWMKELRIHLETKQAANTLMAHAAANGLVYL